MSAAKITFGILMFLGLMGLIGFGTAYTPVDPGHRAVVYDQWDGSSYTLDEGTHFVNPLVYDVFDFAVANQLHKVTAIGVSGKGDLQTVTVEVAVRYHVNRVDTQKLLYEFRSTDLNAICVDVKVQEAVKRVTANYTSTEFATDYREQARGEMLRFLNDPNDGLPKCYIVVDSVDITDVDFSEAVNAQLEAKAVKREEVQTVELEAQKRVVEAEANYRAAELDSNATKLRTDAERYRIEQLQPVITPEYLALQKIMVAQKYAEQWNGAYPTTIMGDASGVVPFFNVNSVSGTLP